MTINHQFRAPRQNGGGDNLEKCTFLNFGSSVTLTLDRVDVTMVRIRGRDLPTHQIRWKSEKPFSGRTHGRTDGT